MGRLTFNLGYAIGSRLRRLDNDLAKRLSRSILENARLHKEISDLKERHALREQSIMKRYIGEKC